MALFNRCIRYFEVKYIDIWTSFPTVALYTLYAYTKMSCRFSNYIVQTDTKFLKPHDIVRDSRCDFCNARSAEHNDMTIITYRCSIKYGWIVCDKCKLKGWYCKEIMESYDELFDARFFGFTNEQFIKIPNGKSTVDGFISVTHDQNVMIGTDGLYVRVEFMHKKRPINKFVSLDKLLEENNMNLRPIRWEFIQQLNTFLRTLVTECDYDDDHITDIKKYYVKYIENPI